MGKRGVGRDGSGKSCGGPKISKVDGNGETGAVEDVMEKVSMGLVKEKKLSRTMPGWAGRVMMASLGSGM